MQIEIGLRSPTGYILWKPANVSAVFLNYKWEQFIRLCIQVTFNYFDAFLGDTCFFLNVLWTLICLLVTKQPSKYIELAIT